VRRSIFTSNRAYTAESVLAQQFVRDTLYVFHARAVVHLPFRWFYIYVYYIYTYIYMYIYIYTYIYIYMYI